MANETYGTNWCRRHVKSVILEMLPDWNKLCVGWVDAAELAERLWLRIQSVTRLRLGGEPWLSGKEAKRKSPKATLHVIATAPERTSAMKAMKDSQVADGLLSIEEAMSFLSLSRSTLYELMDQGMLPYAQIGRSRRIPKRALVELAAANLRGGNALQYFTSEYGSHAMGG